MNNWQSIKTTPKTGKWILLWWPKITNESFTGYWCEVNGKWVESIAGSGWNNYPGLTHWQPLPPPPAEKGE